MKTSQKNCCFLAAAAAMAASAGTARALEPSDLLVFSHGPLSLRPQFRVAETFDDNVFYTKTDRRSDFVTSIAPGLKFQVGDNVPDQNHFVVTYTLDKLIYLDNSGLSTLEHFVRSDAHYEGNRLTVEGQDVYEILSGVLGGAFNVGKQKVDRDVWVDMYRVGYKVGERMGVYVDGQHVETDYLTTLPLFDARTFSGTGGFEYEYSERTFFFGEVYYGQTSLHANAPGAGKPPGTSFTGGFIGARGDFTEKIKGTVKAGYEMSSFTGGSAAGVDTSAGSSPVVEASIAYAPTERFSANFSYSRRQQVSVQFVRSSYVLDTISVGLLELLGSTHRLRLDLSGTYAMYSFDPAAAYPAGRTDSNWKVQTGANYFFESWLYTRLEYSFERFTSDFATVVDYDVNKVTLSVAIGF